jgi:hypothetical protein
MPEPLVFTVHPSGVLAVAVYVHFFVTTPVTEARKVARAVREAAAAGSATSAITSRRKSACRRRTAWILPQMTGNEQAIRSVE